MSTSPTFPTTLYVTSAASLVVSSPFEVTQNSMYGTITIQPGGLLYPGAHGVTIMTQTLTIEPGVTGPAIVSLGQDGVAGAAGQSYSTPALGGAAGVVGKSSIQHLSGLALLKAVFSGQPTVAQVCSTPATNGQPGFAGRAGGNGSDGSAGGDATSMMLTVTGTISGALVVETRGGAGGAGGAGGKGQDGGDGGAAAPSNGACAASFGGPGGAGGQGGHGGNGGAGGRGGDIVINYQALAPGATLRADTPVAPGGAAGAAGAGGQGGGGSVPGHTAANGTAGTAGQNGAAGTVSFNQT